MMTTSVDGDYLQKNEEMSYSEKQSLLGNNGEIQFNPESESTTIGCPSFATLLTKPLQYLPHFSRTLIKDDVEFEDDYDDDEEILPDLPYVVNSIKTPQSKLTQADKLYQLRVQMKIHDIGVYIIPSEDEHQSEYTALADKRREYISGFTGSAGIAIVTLNDDDTLEGEAALSTDGRYFLQAEKELDSKLWKLLKNGVAGYPNWRNYAINKASNNKFSKVISVDPRLISLSIAEYFESSLRFSGKYQFKPLLDFNLVDLVWGDEKPLRSQEPVYNLPLEFAGVHTNDKLKQVRQVLRSEDFNSTHLIVSSLDEIAWLFNLRSDDIPFNPVFFAYAIITLKAVTLYISKPKIDDGSDSLKKYLKSIRGLQIKDYDSFYLDLAQLKVTISNVATSIVLPSKLSTTSALFSSIPQSEAKQRIIYESIISNLKLVKNSTELLNAKIAQYKDSLAFILFSSWLDHSLINKHKTISEYDAACKIYSIREKLPNFKGLSYETILSTGANAAIIHYAPTKGNDSIIDPKKIYLIDSGSHYLEGTTDITRTYKFGTNGLTPTMKKYYTLVLKGHLAVAVAKFPPASYTTGTILDSYARQALWNEGLDYGHGTGHGVSSFGNVHESPLYVLSSGGPNSPDYFKKGAILTDEPGYYIDGEMGFRIESELEIIEFSDKFGTTRSGENFLGFAYLTKVPFCRKLINTEYLSPLEINWINEYHKSIRDEFGDKILELGDKRAYKWLFNETAPL